MNQTDPPFSTALLNFLESSPIEHLCVFLSIFLIAERARAERRHSMRLTVARQVLDRRQGVRQGRVTIPCSKCHIRLFSAIHGDHDRPLFAKRRGVNASIKYVCQTGRVPIIRFTAQKISQRWTRRRCNLSIRAHVPFYGPRSVCF